MDSKDGARDYVGIRKVLDGRSLGELEAQILDIVWDIWDSKPVPVSTTQVFKIMYPRRELSYSTIMLTMSKLARKGILDQRTTGPKRTDPFVYVPSVSREEMALTLMAAIARTIFRKPLHEAILSLCGSEDETTVATLKKLRARVKRAEAKTNQQ